MHLCGLGINPLGQFQFGLGHVGLGWIVAEQPVHLADAAEELALGVEEPGHAAFARKIAFDRRTAGHVAPLEFADLAIGSPGGQQLIERDRFPGPLLLDDFAILHQLGRGRAAHAQFHERDDRLLVGRVRQAEARLTVPGVQEFRVVARRRIDFALALGDRARLSNSSGERR